MKNQVNYERIERAIIYMKAHFKEQPSLEVLAGRAHMSKYHFQRTFTEWAGVSPKKFMQYLSLEHAKERLRTSKTSLLEVAYDTGLSGGGRLYDLFVKVEAMTPGEFKSGGKGLEIHYSSSDSPFGKIVMGSTTKGLCHISFENPAVQAREVILGHFPNASVSELYDQSQRNAAQIFQQDWSQLELIKLHLGGTPFQLKVWESLLKIPFGALRTYADVSKDIDQKNASRAVGSAIGKNPIAYLIPCHRVIQKSGHLGGYRWGENRKAAILGWEACRTEESR